jgi:hypothetical protein
MKFQSGFGFPLPKLGAAGDVELGIVVEEF